MVDFPQSFLQDILQKYENDRSVRVTGVRTGKACKKGENFMSLVLKIIVTISRNGTDLTKSLVVKQPHKSDKIREMFCSDEIFRNEVIAYNEVIPVLKQFYEQLPVAECVYADDQYIMLDDLTQYGYELHQGDANMDYEQCSAVLQALAAYHSASAILKHRRGALFSQLAAKVRHGLHSNKNIISKHVVKSFSDTLALLRSLERCELVANAIVILEQLKVNVYERVCDLIRVKGLDDRAVFIHGDCWRNNILFGRTPGGHVHVKFVDLQGVSVTSPAFDIAYFLHIHLAPENRHRLADQLLTVYMNVLHSSFTSHGLPELKHVYTKEWLVRELDDFALFGFMCGLWVTPVFYLDDHTVVQHMHPELKERLLSLVFDFTNRFKL